MCVEGLAGLTNLVNAAAREALVASIPSEIVFQETVAMQAFCRQSPFGDVVGGGPCGRPHRTRTGAARQAVSHFQFDRQFTKCSEANQIRHHILHRKLHL